MCNNGFGGCSWIIILILILCCCGCGNSGYGNNGCQCTDGRNLFCRSQCNLCRGNADTGDCLSDKKT